MNIKKSMGRMELSVRKSDGGMFWNVMFGGQVIEAYHRKHEAIRAAESMGRVVGVKVGGVK